MLEKSDLYELNIDILNDTNRLCINKSWFSKYKINIYQIHYQNLRTIPLII